MPGNPPSEALSALRSGGKPALARALARVETHWRDGDLVALLDEAWSDGAGHVIGLTGPPGVGKSTLTSALAAAFRRAGDSVGIIAVDPSSRASGGALLGDRTRIETDPDDAGIFIRSMAARDRLGGLSEQTFAATALMRAVFDMVIVETVGVGQSEGDVALVADTTVLCVQPASGDSLQFMKAGIMELPDILVVTKADLGAPAERARAELESAVRLTAPERPVPVVAVSTAGSGGIDRLLEALAASRRVADDRDARQGKAQAWLRDMVLRDYGRAGLRSVNDLAGVAFRHEPFSAEKSLAEALQSRWK